MEDSIKLDIGKDTDQTEILRKINDALTALGVDEEWIKAPEFLPEYEKLKGKRITIVDDVKGVIANNLPEYIVATGGNASAVCHTEQDLNGLVVEVLATNPEIVLMDYTLLNGITGVGVIGALRANGFEGKVIGYSSEKSRNSEFMKAGAIGCIGKSAYPASKSVQELITILGGK